jgi:hypothetical protein
MADTIQLNTHEDPIPPVEGTKEHETSMIQLAEDASSVEREDQQPSWLPDKFKSPEDMAQAYRDLEKKLSLGTESVANNDEVTSPPQTPQPTLEEAKQQLADQGLNYDKYAREFNDTSGLSPESYKELQDKGLTTEVVDSWIQGQQALADKMIEAVHTSVGGQNEYNNLLEWAKTSLSKLDQESFNRAVESDNPNDGLFAVKSLNAQYQMENGSSPNLIQGTTGSSGSGSFSSLAQMSEAMRDPKYLSDPAFREDVSRKLESSNLM